jgi:hypothetical protein
LVGTAKTSKWIQEGISRYPIEKPQKSVAFYSDWLKRTKNLYDICQSVDSNVNAEDIWKEFNQDCIMGVLEGCNIPYVITAKDTELTAKIRQLVTSLSSYKIAFIDGDSTDRFTDSIVAVVSGSAFKHLTTTSREYIAPILDSTCQPHIACYEIQDDGCIMMRTPDTYAVEGKVYYKLVNTSNVNDELENDEFEVIDVPVIIGEQEVMIPTIEVTDNNDLDVVTYEGVSFEEDTLLPPNTYYEKIDIRRTLGVSGRSIVVEFKRENGKWYCRVGASVVKTKVVPTYASDWEADKSQDTFIQSLKIDETEKKKLISYKYRKTIAYNDYGWTAWMDAPKSLKDHLAVFAASRTVYLHDTIDLDIIVERAASES